MDNPVVSSPPKQRKKRATKRKRCHHLSAIPTRLSLRKKPSLQVELPPWQDSELLEDEAKRKISSLKPVENIKFSQMVVVVATAFPGLLDSWIPVLEWIRMLRRACYLNLPDEREYMAKRIPAPSPVVFLKKYDPSFAFDETQYGPTANQHKILQHTDQVGIKRQTFLMVKSRKSLKVPVPAIWQFHEALEKAPWPDNSFMFWGRRLVLDSWCSTEAQNLFGVSGRKRNRMDRDHIGLSHSNSIHLEEQLNARVAAEQIYSVFGVALRASAGNGIKELIEGFTVPTTATTNSNNNTNDKEFNPENYKLCEVNRMIQFYTLVVSVLHNAMKLMLQLNGFEVVVPYFWNESINKVLTDISSAPQGACGSFGAKSGHRVLSAKTVLRHFRFFCNTGKFVNVVQQRERLGSPLLHSFPSLAKDIKDWARKNLSKLSPSQLQDYLLNTAIPQLLLDLTLQKNPDNAVDGLECVLELRRVLKDGKKNIDNAKPFVTQFLHSFRIEKLCRKTVRKWMAQLG